VAAAPAAASAAVTGSAYDLSLRTNLVNRTVTVGPSIGPIYSSGTTDTKKSALSAGNQFASAQVLTAEVRTSQGVYSSATATIASVTASVPGAPTIQATALYTNATASCNLHPSLSARSTGVVIVAGKTYDLAQARPNTVINFGLGTITLNEQRTSGTVITARAVDVRTIDGTQLIISDASAGCA
jgi:hypothetical protein